MVFINWTGIIGTVLSASVTNVTGELYLTLLVIFMALIVVSFIFRLPMDIAIALMLPMTLVVMSGVADFIAIGGAILFFVAILLIKYFFLNR